ncbi:MAG: GNAT family N-acetyltransferase [Mycobacteriales bacterium]
MQVRWYDESDRAGLTALVQAVAAEGGAVGWLSVPAPEQVHDWVGRLLAGGARLAVAGGPGEVVACGSWRRYDGQVLHTMASVNKVMTHPQARGRGAARVVVEALVADAQGAGVELITLDCRGNNHGAQRLYASLGFVVTGRRPDVIAVGDERFDQVLMHRDLRTGPSGLTRHGSRRKGPGST